MNTFAVVIRYSDNTFNSAPFTMEGDNVGDLLETIFAQWNAGSGQECERFIADVSTRSLSVGDFVRVNNKWYRCEGMGWKEVPISFVETWFDEMHSFAMSRPISKDFYSERIAKMGDRRKVEDKLGVYCF